MIGVEPEIIQRAPTDRICVLILRKRFAIPTDCPPRLSDSPRLVAVTLIVKCTVVCPTGFLRRRMKTDVADVRSGNQWHTEGLNSAVEVYVIKGVFIMPHTGTGISHLITHEPNSIVAGVRLGLVHCGASPGHNSRLHAYRCANRLKCEIGWTSANIKLAVGGIVKHVALVRMSVAPGILVWTNVSGFAKIGRAGILCCVQVTVLHPDPVRHPIMMMAAVIVGVRWKRSGERIDPGARTDAVLVAIQA